MDLSRAPPCPRLTLPSGKFQQNVPSQLQSSLFGVLPAEIRLMIWAYTLTDYEDYSGGDRDKLRYNFYEAYMPQRRIDTQLLRSCKHILQETWRTPFKLAMHEFSCSQYVDQRMREYLAVLRKFKSSRGQGIIPQIQQIRVFTIWDESKWLHNVFSNLEEFRPKYVTIDMSATLYDQVSVDKSLKFQSLTQWTAKVNFPVSVNTIEIEINRARLSDWDGDAIKALAAKKWHLRREDGATFKTSKFNLSWKTMRGETSKRRPLEKGLCPRWHKTLTWTFTPEFVSSSKS